MDYIESILYEGERKSLEFVLINLTATLSIITYSIGLPKSIADLSYFAALFALVIFHLLPSSRSHEANNNISLTILNLLIALAVLF